MSQSHHQTEIFTHRRHLLPTLLHLWHTITLAIWLLFLSRLHNVHTLLLLKNNGSRLALTLAQNLTLKIAKTVLAKEIFILRTQNFL